MKIKLIGIFCSSSFGSNPVYVETARATADLLAKNKIGLITGGGQVGLMGVMADAALAAGGEVIGVMPRHLVEREIAHTGLTDLHIVETMHDRKVRMAELADCFVALPGGAGTLEEILEQWTWAQLGLHSKPCALLNVHGYFDPLLLMIERAVSHGFLRGDHADMLIVEDKIAPILSAFETYSPPQEKWASRSSAP